MIVCHAEGSRASLVLHKRPVRPKTVRLYSARLTRGKRTTSSASPLHVLTYCPSWLGSTPTRVVEASAWPEPILVQTFAVSPSSAEKVELIKGVNRCWPVLCHRTGGTQHHDERYIRPASTALCLHRLKHISRTGLPFIFNSVCSSLSPRLRMALSGKSRHITLCAPSVAVHVRNRSTGKTQRDPGVRGACDPAPCRRVQHEHDVVFTHTSCGSSQV